MLIRMPAPLTRSRKQTACSVKSSNSDGSTIQPVQSARISTMNSTSIAFGKVEVRAKLPRGDWLWPAIWMLPKDDKYGAWPLSGEIDVGAFPPSHVPSH